MKKLTLAETGKAQREEKPGGKIMDKFLARQRHSNLLQDLSFLLSGMNMRGSCKDKAVEPKTDYMQRLSVSLALSELQPLHPENHKVTVRFETAQWHVARSPGRQQQGG